MKRFVLASSSPRRRELLEKFGFSFVVAPSMVDEEVDESASAEAVVMQLAEQKAEDIANAFPEGIVLGADTVVVFEGNILGKPKDRQEAKEMLQMLSNNTHIVYTGVALITNAGTETFYESTNVTFRELTDEEIDAYIQTGEPFDKAGSYGIQDLGGAFVQEISGDYFNVVGLPIMRVIQELRALGVKGVLG
ncbi:Maf family protein [Bacillus tianshenii]|nr:Maf family protein [Bacillus tianshenii]